MPSSSIKNIVILDGLMKNHSGLFKSAIQGRTLVDENPVWYSDIDRLIAGISDATLVIVFASTISQVASWGPRLKDIPNSKVVFCCWAKDLREVYELLPKGIVQLYLPLDSKRFALELVALNALG